MRTTCSRECVCVCVGGGGGGGGGGGSLFLRPSIPPVFDLTRFFSILKNWSYRRSGNEARGGATVLDTVVLIKV